MTGLDVCITFMIIFYVSYCYARYEKQFDDVEMIMRSVVHTCAPPPAPPS